MDTIKISAKNLGAIAMPDFCPRCFWIKLKTAKLPWQIFPGIFSSIDAYTKHCVHAAIKTAAWLGQLGEIVSFQKVKKAEVHDTATDIILSGIPDDILICADGSAVIPDYKTAKHTDNQDKLYPMYEGQMNSYARIYDQEARLFLVYMSPVTDEETARENVNTGGFKLPFVASPVPVKNDPAIIDRLLEKTREIYEMPEAPAGNGGCKDCEALDNIIGLIR